MRLWFLPLFLAVAAAAFGQNLVSNWSFESVSITANSTATGTALNIPGWTFGSDVLLLNGTVANYPTPTLGAQAVVLDSFSPPVQISQDITTTIGQSYQLSITWAREDATYAFNNDTILYVTISDAGIHTLSRTQTAPATFSTDVITFTAFDTTTILTFSSTNNPEERSPVIDSVSVTAVPEPSTYALLGGLAALGLVALRRRK